MVIRYDIWDSPCEGGDIVTKKVDGLVTTWIHQFTNAASDLSQGGVLKFQNTAGCDLKVRYLVVGAGGAGGRYSDPGTYYGGGGGGGGGGVCEKSQIPFAVGSAWQITVGKGSGGSAVAGASSISNGVTDVETVPGGGNGASPMAYVRESIEVINRVFTHWFCLNYRAWAGREMEMPFDQHMMVSCIAPTCFRLSTHGRK